MSRDTRAFEENAGCDRNECKLQHSKRGPARPLLFWPVATAFRRQGATRIIERKGGGPRLRPGMA